jgi:hypothetical protein
VSVELLGDSSSESKGENDAFRFSIISLGAKRKGFESRTVNGLAAVVMDQEVIQVGSRKEEESLSR